MSLMEEILSQPNIVARVIDNYDDIARVAAEIKTRDIAFAYIAARGTSDNAGIYAKYLWGIFNNLVVAQAAPSQFSVYNEPPNLRGSLVVGVSQSGQSPDNVCVLKEAKAQSALTLAITNDPTSPLANTADLVIDIGAGVEKAVAATKTYTAELVIVAMLSAFLSDDGARLREIMDVPRWIEEALGSRTEIECNIDRYRDMEQCVVLGRGYNYATAFEWALKIKELSCVAALPYSSADFQHGPIAIVDQGYRVLAVAPIGKSYPQLTSQIEYLSSTINAELVVISNGREALDLADSPITIPHDIPEWLSPLVSIIPAQLFCYYLTNAKGYDVERPRRLMKVTKTY